MSTTDSFCNLPRKIHARDFYVEDLDRAVVHEDSDLLVLDKPAGIVCHPSKAGPLSSLVGAIRVHRGLEHPHLVSRLDRETSGLVVVAKTNAMARRLQMAIARRRVKKVYLAIVHGNLVAETTVDQPLGDDLASPVAIKTSVVADGREARTVFTPIAHANGYSLVRAIPETGRKHQIRAHAQWMGHSLVGDKLYGPDPLLYLEFVAGGWTEKLAAALILPRHALHCFGLDLTEAGVPHSFSAPLAGDLADFCAEHGIK